MRLTRVTTQYDSEQDRFRLLASTPEDKTIALWLTQRLLIQVVKILLDWLDQTQPEQELAKANSHDPEIKSSLQNFAQQNANAAMEPAMPVEANVETKAWLISEIDIQHGDEHVVLVFKLPDESLAEVPFDATQLRQWLNIVLDQWVTAEWPTTIWPQWILEAKNAPSSAARTSYH